MKPINKKLLIYTVQSRVIASVIYALQHGLVYRYEISGGIFSVQEGRYIVYMYVFTAEFGCSCDCSFIYTYIITTKFVISIYMVMRIILENIRLYCSI